MKHWIEPSIAKETVSHFVTDAFLCVANEDNDSCRECDYYKGVSENYFKSFALIEFRIKLVQP